MNQRRMVIRYTCAIVLGLGMVGGCGGDDVAETPNRGVPGGKPAAPQAATDTKTDPVKPADRGLANPASGPEAEPGLPEAPPRPPVQLDARTFSIKRDPFHQYSPPAAPTPTITAPKAERKVKMDEYAFEDLKLIAIVNSRRGFVPRAVFLASDGKSKTIRQGEYFSSAEVLLAAVNPGSVEVEVVDDGLAGSLNLQRGQRRALFLRNE